MTTAATSAAASKNAAPCSSIAKSESKRKRGREAVDSRVGKPVVCIADIERSSGREPMNTPTGGRPNRARALLALAILIGVSAAACAASVARPVTDAPWYSIVPPLLAVIAALLTGRMLASLLTAVFVGGWLSAWSATTSPLATVGGGVWKAVRFLWLSVMSPEFSILAPGSFRVTDSQLILLYVVLIMAAITVVLTGGGLQGVADWLSRFARGRRSAQVVTFLAGLAVFIDDYANTMIVGRIHAAGYRPAPGKPREAGLSG